MVVIRVQGTAVSLALQLLITLTLDTKKCHTKYLSSRVVDCKSVFHDSFGFQFGICLRVRHDHTDEALLLLDPAAVAACLQYRRAKVALLL